jgi:CRP/FNR family transcriptional regulator, cyclic AMP receptor protein
MVDTLEPFLARLPFFEGLEKRHLELLVGCASNAHYVANEYLYREGEEANQFYIIRQGKVSIEMAVPGHGMVSLQSHEEGAVVGWAWLLRPFHWFFSARVVVVTWVITLDGAYLRRKCEQDHTLGYELHKRFAAKMERTLDLLYMQLIDLYAAPLQELAHV